VRPAVAPNKEGDVEKAADPKETTKSTVARIVDICVGIIVVCLIIFVFRGLWKYFSLAGLGLVVIAALIVMLMLRKMIVTFLGVGEVLSRSIDRQEQEKAAGTSQTPTGESQTQANYVKCLLNKKHQIKVTSKSIKLVKV
jgi:uncharacterized membrane protein YcjF (UPF0283 family)